MDSGNSACSMQSSSGGDEEFDSYKSTGRGDGDHHQSSISSFFSNTSPNLAQISAPQQNPAFFDPMLSNPFPQSNDLVWSQNYTGFGNLSSNPSPPSVPLPAQTHGGRGSKPSAGSDRLSAVGKNPKKRSRASRRAPTTVLATDTANFRQMVQEFTGIPDAPFRGGGGSPYSRRLDLFSAAAALRSGGGANFGSLSPFPSSALPPAMLNSTTMVDSVVPTTTAVGGGSSTSNNSSNYQLAPDSNLLNLQQQHRRVNPLQLGGNTAASMSLGDLSGFRSGGTVRNTDGVEENLVTFDGNNVNSGDSQRINGYNLNVSDKSVENTVSNWGR